MDGTNSVMSSLIMKKTIYSNRNEQDAFFIMSFDNRLLNLSCYRCKCSESFDYCDIRLGDYWRLNSILMLKVYL